MAKLNKLYPRKHTGLVAGAVDADVRPHLNAVADDDQTGVKDGKAE